MAASVSGAAIVAHDPAFLEATGPAPSLVRVAATDAHEGPVYAPDEDALYFTTVPRPDRTGPRVDIRRLALDGSERLTTLRADANVANGMALAADGRLLVCEQGDMRRPAAMALVDRATGARETLVDAWRGLPLNSPNDVVERTDGTVWFTDPGYGALQGFRPAPALPDRVYRFDPSTGALDVVAEGFDKPNGLAFSPDERTLYVGDSGAIHEPGDYDPDRPRNVTAFGVAGGRRLTGARPAGGPLPGFPDGIEVDADGRLYVACAAGVRVLDPSGTLLGEIAVPGGAVNLTFGGPGRDVLLITADDAVWAASLHASRPQP